ncbi:MAG: hypothetical protein ACRYFZ_01795 [Janthinobacterium lividum]
MKNLFAVIFTLCLMLSIAVPGYSGPGRPSFGGGRPSYSGGFRSSSSPSYRSFSSSPSRTFTFRPSAPSYSRPAAAPRTYSAPAASQRTTYRSTTKQTVINNHYHGDGGHGSGGGLSLTDYMVLHSLTNQNNGPTYVNAQPAAAGVPVVVNPGYDAPRVIYQQEESHFWRNFFLIILAVVVIAGFVAVLVHYLDLDEEYSK